ncbi:hypothetical protein H6F43_04185 [Leptolyngbya sp. FACHB-36]|nr:hypothetical protein [Leptolyngbya sp. FACHB-36]
MKFIQEIRRVLDNPPTLLFQDFKIDEKQNRSHIVLKVLYLLQQDKYFQARIPLEKSKRIAVDSQPNIFSITSSRVVHEFKIEAEFCPGEISQNEKITLTDSAEMITAIESWVGRLLEEIRYEPIDRKIEQQHQQLENLEELIAQVADEAATKEEVTEIRSNLEHFIEDLRLRIEDLEAKDQDQVKKVEALVSQLELLSQRVESISKRNLARAILTRIYVAASDPKLSQIAENAQKVLGLLGGGSGS